MPCPHYDIRIVQRSENESVVAAAGVRHNTVAGYKTVINVLKKEAFGRQRIDKVHLSDVKAWIRDFLNTEDIPTQE